MNEETSRQRALLNAPVPARFISMASDGSGGAAAARKAALESKEDGTTVLPGETLLHLCARRGHHCLCSLLLEYGANARIKDSHGYTPLHVSVIFGSSLVTRQLSTEFPRLRRCIQTLSVYVRAWLLRKYRRNTVTSQEISSVPIVVDPDGQVKGSIDGANEERAGDEYMETSKRTPVGYERLHYESRVYSPRASGSISVQTDSANSDRTTASGDPSIHADSNYEPSVSSVDGQESGETQTVALHAESSESDEDGVSYYS